jgi:hypothetical protein
MQTVGDAPVKQALARASLGGGSVTSSVTTEPLRDLLERFSIVKDLKGSRGGAEALFVLQVGICNDISAAFTSKPSQVHAGLVVRHSTSPSTSCIVGCLYCNTCARGLCCLGAIYARLCVGCWSDCSGFEVSPWRLPSFFAGTTHLSCAGFSAVHVASAAAFIGMPLCLSKQCAVCPVSCMRCLCLHRRARLQPPEPRHSLTA